MASQVSVGVAPDRATAEATLARYKARLYRNFGARGVAYRTPYGWLIVFPLLNGQYRFELHPNSASGKCPCEA